MASIRRKTQHLSPIEEDEEPSPERRQDDTLEMYGAFNIFARKS